MNLSPHKRVLLALSLSLLACDHFALAQDAKPNRAKSRKGSSSTRRNPTTVPGAKYLGQDGHDVIGTEPSGAGDELQDMHIELVGLPPDKAIEYLVVKALGGGEWTYNGPKGPWRWARIVREPKATVADLYLVAYQVETGRPLEIHYRLEGGGGETVNLNLQGGKADPTLRMPGAELKAKWLGQDGRDHVGQGPAVGPDGFQDAHVLISGLASKVEVESVVVLVDGKPRYETGMNKDGLGNALLVPQDKAPAKADLFFAVEREMVGKKISLTVKYKNGRKEAVTLATGKADGSKRAASGGKLPVVRLGPKAKWIGQDGKSPRDPLADIHVVVENLAPGVEVVAAALGDGVIGEWFTKANDRIPVHAQPFATPMTFVRSTPTSADVFFPPCRDETGTKLVLRMVLADRSLLLTTFDGSTCDLDRLVAIQDRGSVQAKPGDDLNALADRFSTVKLAAGTTYPIDRPLVLEHQVTIKGEPGATLLFTQRPDDAPWSTAIKIHSSHTTLEGFKIRFTGPVRWREGLDNGPGLIGSTDRLDPPHADGKIGIRLRKLDIESPPAKSTWEEAPRLMRLATSTSGEIASNTLKGGMIEFNNGPWTVVDNDFQGAPTGTYNFAVFSGRRTHDVLIQRNKARQTMANGKTWRFLVLADHGRYDRILDNDVAGIGPRDGESYPNQNSPEVMLTESYRLRFEGSPSAVSTDGWLVRIPSPQGDQPSVGDVVAVLSGKNAGAWRTIAQVIDPSTFLLREPLPKMSPSDAIAISNGGFVRESFVGNTVDCHDGSVAANLVLVGNHYGVRIAKNHLIGRGNVFLLTAAPTESPVHWGWSHAPFLDGVVEENHFEDTLSGGKIAVEHSSAIKTNKGRVYMTLTFINNTFEWSSHYFSSLSAQDRAKPILAAKIGDPDSHDPGELLVREEGNRAVLPAGSSKSASFSVQSAMVNEQLVRKQRIELATKPSDAKSRSSSSKAEPKPRPRTRR